MCVCVCVCVVSVIVKRPAFPSCVVDRCHRTPLYHCSAESPTNSAMMKRPSLKTSNTEKPTRTPVKRLFSYYTRRVLWLLGIMNSLDKQGSGNVPWEGDFLTMWTHGKNKLPRRVERQHCSCTLLIYFGNLCWRIQKFTYQWFIYAQSAVEVMIRWRQKLPNHDSLFMWSRVLTSALAMLHSLHTQFTNCLPTVHQLKNAVYIHVCVCVRACVCVCVHAFCKPTVFWRAN